MAGGKDPELRLGLVLYGGVSLAVYIYGVVVEVQRLLQASAAREGAGAGTAGAGYAAALDEGGLSRASVDVIAGTSAGGINGILLAKALATGADVETVRDLWIEGGDIGGLLRRTDAADADSLLSTEVMEGQLAKGFGLLDTGGGGPVADGALDLFVSATHLRGDRRQFEDSLGAGIDTFKHRYVFQLKRRPLYVPPRDDFAPSQATGPGAPPNAHLVKLSRATSAFPVAFEPVMIDRAVDGILDPRDEESAWFSDGGILNNKPFTEALQTIFTRSSDRPVRRWLLSVDPDPKPVDRPPAPGPQPAFDQIAASAIAKIPSYQSIARDLESLAEHNAAVRRIAALVTDLEWELSGGEPPLEGPSPAYRRLRTWAWIEEIADRLMLAARPSDPSRFDPTAVRRGFVRAAHEVLLAGGWEGEGWAELPDLAFELRRIYYLIKLIGMAQEIAAGDGDSLRASLWAVFESIDNSLWASLSAEPIALDPEGGSDQARAEGGQRLAAALDGFAEVRGAAAVAVEEAIAAVFALLLRRAPSEPGAAQTFEVELLQVFSSFAHRDAVLLPIEAGGGLRQRDLVEHAQISPAAARSTGVPAADKLAGDTVGHFGGFLDEEWRKNDLLWGRLDAAEILVGAIMSGSTEAERAPVLEAIQVEILEAELPEALQAPGGDWRAYLLENAIGDAEMAGLPQQRIESLKTRAGFVLRGMLRKAAADAKSDPATPPKDARSQVLSTLDRVLKHVGRFFYPYVLILRRRARKSEPPR